MLPINELLKKLHEYEMIINIPCTKWGSIQITGFYYFIEENKTPGADKE